MWASLKACLKEMNNIEGYIAGRCLSKADLILKSFYFSSMYYTRMYVCGGEGSVKDLDGDNG